MKRKLSKILGIALTVALLTSLLISVSPALALQQPTVTVSDLTISKLNPSYTIYTKTAVYLGANSTVTITLPAGTVVDNSTAVAGNSTTIAGTISAGPGWNNANPPVYGDSVVRSLTWSGDATARTITAKIAATDKIMASAEIYINITKGITNPPDPGTVSLTLKTSGETTPVTSNTYTIVEPTLGALPGVATAYNSAGIAMNQSNKINDVIGNAGVGGKVVITAGTYSENVNINKASITLEAAAGVIIPATNTLTIAAANVVVKGFTVKSSTTAGDRVIVTAAGDNAKIENCTIEASATGDAIDINAGAIGVQVVNNTIAAGAKNGVLIAGITSNAEVSGNTMTVTTGGTAIAAAGNATIKTNTITGSSGTGISVTGGVATIEGNTLKTLDTAINYSAAVAGASIKANTIDGCGNAAAAAVINVATAANTTFQNNIIQNSNAKSYAFVIAGGGCVNANFNNILNNTLNVKATAGAQNFKLNWWGDASGAATTSISATPPATINTTSPLGATPSAGSTSSINVATVTTKTTVGVDINSATAAGVASNMKEVGVTQLTANPIDTTPPILGTGKVDVYWDIYVNPNAAGDVLTIKLYSSAVNEYSKIYVGGGLSGLWSLASNQGVNVPGGYAWFTTSGTSTPTTGEMTGTPVALVTDKTLAAPALTAAAGATPVIGAYDISVTPTFTWGAVAGADHYQINLCEDPSFTILEWAYNVDTPFFKADEALRNETTYYWRVRGVLDAASTAFTPWATGIFTTEAEAVAVEAPINVEPVVPEVTVEIPPTKITVEPSAPAIPTYLLWIIVVVGAVLVIALIVLIVRTRRVA